MQIPGHLQLNIFIHPLDWHRQPIFNDKMTTHLKQSIMSLQITTEGQTSLLDLSDKLLEPTCQIVNTKPVWALKRHKRQDEDQSINQYAFIWPTALEETCRRLRVLLKHHENARRFIWTCQHQSKSRQKIC